MTARSAALRTVLSLLALTAISCSSSPSQPIQPPSQEIIFTPGSPSPGPGTVTLQTVSSTQSTLVIDVVATGLPNVAGVFFDLVFNETILSFGGAVEGSFFSSGGATSFLAEFDTTNGQDDGRVVISAAVLGGVSVRGNGVIGTLTFQRVATGTSGISFERSGGLEPNGDMVAGLVFSGGSASVR